MLTGLKGVTLTCVFYRPEHNTNWEPMDFEGLGLQKRNISTNRYSRQEKWGHLCRYHVQSRSYGY